ncbi:hypothetical protein [Synechococcus sp. PCC 7336]|uniref:DUF7219 family protein n=1 Tax=Synechococcus sp. PCC 7336 TaxID=195250 RepID=UPI000348FD98|nr:hypothetical protein [Synechococcus sp. PCC 7336]
MTSNRTLDLGYPARALEKLSYLTSTPAQAIYRDCLKRFIRRIGAIRAMETEGKIDREKAYDGILFCWEQLQQSQRDLGLAEDSAA